MLRSSYAGATRSRRRTLGQGLVEFAVITPLFFLLLFGIIEMGRMIWTNHEVANGTREGTRYAMVHGTKSGAQATSAEVKAYMLTQMQGITPANLTVNVSYSGTGNPGDKVTVTTSYIYQPAIYYVLKQSSITLTSTSTVTVQH